jgi:glycosyltransferase involved in cell wall biosynthesis
MGLRNKFLFPYENQAQSQSHIADAARRAIRDWGIDHVLVDYVPATLFWKGLRRLPIAKTVVTVNREADLYAEMLAIGDIPFRGPLSGRVSHWRLKRFEKSVHRTFDKVVAIGAPDLPPYLPAARTAVVTSYLQEDRNSWTFRPNKTLFFVGNVAHYPNRLAINHIVSKLAPRILARVPDVRFAIVGASPEQVPTERHHPAINLLGTSTPAEVEHLFTTAALFICPVENTFGMKFKVAEAAAYGAPFVASEQVMLGFPYLQGLPHLTLADPDRSADVIAGLLSEEDKLKVLSAEIVRRQRAFAASQKNIWSRTLFALN